MSLRPPPEGWHIPERNFDGTLKGRLDPKDTEKKEAKLKSDIEKYAARSREAEERMLKQAKGIREPNESAPPSDVLRFVELQLLADPATLDGKGAGRLRTLTDDQRRARMDEQAADARKVLDKAINPEPEERFGYALVRQPPRSSSSSS